MNVTSIQVSLDFWIKLASKSQILAAMSSSSSDDVTQSVRPSVRSCVRPGPFFDS